MDDEGDTKGSFRTRFLVADVEPLARSLLIDFPQQRVIASAILHRPAIPDSGRCRRNETLRLRCESTCFFLQARQSRKSRDDRPNLPNVIFEVTRERVKSAD